jgi:hypothetical protein
MPEEIERKIRTLEEIRRDLARGVYLNPFKARAHISFLLDLIDDLTEALFKISAGILEATKHDPNVNPGSKHDPDALAS